MRVLLVFDKGVSCDDSPGWEAAYAVVVNDRLWLPTGYAQPSATEVTMECADGGISPIPCNACVRYAPPPESLSGASGEGPVEAFELDMEEG